MYINSLQTLSLEKEENTDQNYLLTFSKKILSGTLAVCQTVWTKVRTDVLSVLIWVQTVCKCYQQTTNVDKSREIFGLNIFISNQFIQYNTIVNHTNIRIRTEAKAYQVLLLREIFKGLHFYKYQK